MFPLPPSVTSTVLSVTPGANVLSAGLVDSQRGFLYYGTMDSPAKVSNHKPFVITHHFTNSYIVRTIRMYIRRWSR